jgi:hypothetical protein
MVAMDGGNRTQQIFIRNLQVDGISGKKFLPWLEPF